MAKRNIKQEAIPDFDDVPVTGEGVEMVGNYPTLQRVKTGLYSLDNAMASGAELGLPLRVIIEIYGNNNVGKSTLAYYLAGKIADAMHGGICVADLEMLDMKYIPKAISMSGYKGRAEVLDVSDASGKPLVHEKILMNMARKLLDEANAVVIWDSVGATKSLVELSILTDPKAQFGEAFMGRDAKLVTQVTSAIRTAMMTKSLPSSAIAINHVHGVIGGRGHITKGGERLKYLAGVRAMMWTAESFYSGDDESTPVGFLVRGRIEKLRFGGRGREFQFYIVPDFGVHQGVSAMFDCFDLGLAERDNRVKLDGKSLGYLKADLLTYAAEGKSRKFYPFLDLLMAEYERIEHGN